MGEVEYDDDEDDEPYTEWEKIETFASFWQPDNFTMTIAKMDQA